jgi:hypothetical protein
MSVVYQHRRKDTNEVFYIGIGKTVDRAFVKNRRNPYWTNIANKHGYQVDILIDGCSWEEACEVERGMIKEYGRADLSLGALANMTNGGDGLRNPSKETRKKIGDARVGKKMAKETINKIVASKIGKPGNNKNKTFSKEWSDNIGKSMVGVNKNRRWITNGIIYKFIKNDEVLLNDWYYEAPGKGINKNKPSWNKDIAMSDTSKEKLKITLNNKPKIKCEYCGGEYDFKNFGRWHGKNCKYKK